MHPPWSLVGVATLAAGAGRAQASGVRALGRADIDNATEELLDPSAYIEEQAGPLPLWVVVLLTVGMLWCGLLAFGCYKYQQASSHPRGGGDQVTVRSVALPADALELETRPPPRPPPRRGAHAHSSAGSLPPASPVKPESFAEPGALVGDRGLQRMIIAVDSYDLRSASNLTEQTPLSYGPPSVAPPGFVNFGDAGSASGLGHASFGSFPRSSGRGRAGHHRTSIEDTSCTRVLMPPPMRSSTAPPGLGLLPDTSSPSRAGQGRVQM